MRDFKNPNYDGPECVCCKAKTAEAAEQRILNLLKDEARRHQREGLYTAYVYIKEVIRMIEDSNDGAK
jgi:hypothetical protein